MTKVRFLRELRRRHVFRVAAGYAIVGWLLIQIATQVFPFFDLPNWSVRLIVLIVLAGFPIALVLAWRSMPRRRALCAHRMQKEPCPAARVGLASRSARPAR